MLKTERGVVTTLFCATLLALIACGGDDDPPGNPGPTPGGSDGDVRNGTWRVTTHSVWTECPLPDSLLDTTDTIEENICNLEARFEAASVGTTVACDVEIDGDSYAVVCSGDSTTLGCTINIVLDAGGTYTDSTYTFEGTAIFEFSGPSNLPYCNALPPCTLDVTETGVWINDDGACEDDTSAVTALSPAIRQLKTLLGP